MAGKFVQADRERERLRRAADALRIHDAARVGLMRERDLALLAASERGVVWELLSKDSGLSPKALSDALKRVRGE